MSDLENIYGPRVSVATFNGKAPVMKCVNVTPRVFNTYLIDDLYMTKERACKIGKAVEHLWEEATYLDCRNRSAIMDLTVAELLDLYGAEEGAYSSFKETHNKYKEMIEND